MCTANENKSQALQRLKHIPLKLFYLLTFFFTLNCYLTDLSSIKYAPSIRYLCSCVPQNMFIATHKYFQVEHPYCLTPENYSQRGPGNYFFRQEMSVWGSDGRTSSWPWRLCRSRYAPVSAASALDAWTVMSAHGLWPAVSRVGHWGLGLCGAAAAGTASQRESWESGHKTSPWGLGPREQKTGDDHDCSMLLADVFWC